MRNDPLVTVNILSFNRKDELRNTLLKVFEQDYKHIEVIVVDNASSDGSPEMVEKEFPAVNLIRLNKNIGIAGWNEGFRIAKGKHVLVLDDDAYPDKRSIDLMVNEFENNENIGAIAIKVMNIYVDTGNTKILNGWVPNSNENTTNNTVIMGCAFFIKKEIYINDLFCKNYFLCAHEFPIILRLFISNYKIFFSPKIIAYHYNQLEYREPSKLRLFYHYRNMSNFVFYHFPKPLNIILFLRISTLYFFKSFKHSWLKNYVKALFSINHPLILFSQDRLSADHAKRILETGVIDYKIGIIKRIFRIIEII